MIIAMFKCNMCGKSVNSFDLTPYPVSGRILFICPECVSKVTLVVKESED